MIGKIYTGGRGSGKTQALLEHTVEYATNNPGKGVFVLAPDTQQAQQIYDRLTEMLTTKTIDAYNITVFTTNEWRSTMGVNNPAFFIDNLDWVLRGTAARLDVLASRGPIIAATIEAKGSEHLPRRPKQNYSDTFYGYPSNDGTHPNSTKTYLDSRG